MIDNRLNEEVRFEHLENGLDVILITKKNATNYYATYATHFGSLNYKFKAPGDENITEVPDGVAHFLEHKLFEEEDGINALEKFTNLGVNANAYTSFNHTAYLFSCNSHFDEALDILLNFVQNPYLTDENVEKEKGIIGQEIKMYDDDPEWQVAFNLLLALYGPNHAVSKDIAGTCETIAKITPEILYKCYNTFYDPSNMVITVAGDIDAEKVLQKIKDKVKNCKEKPNIERYYGEISPNVYNKKVEKNMDVNMPLCVLGFKDTKSQRLRMAGYKEDNKDLIKRDIAIEIILSLIAGESSNLEEELYNEGKITKPFDISFTFEEDYAYSSFGFESNNVDEVIDRLKNEIEKLKKNGIDVEEMERTKKMLYGGFIRIFNDSTNMAMALTSDYFKGINTLDNVDLFKTVDKEYITEVLNEHFDFDNMAISIVNPNTK